MNEEGSCLFSLGAFGETPFGSLQQEELGPDKKQSFLSPLQRMEALTAEISCGRRQQTAMEGGEGQ